MPSDDPRDKALADLLRDCKALQRRSHALIKESDKIRVRAAKLKEYGPKPKKGRKKSPSK